MTAITWGRIREESVVVSSSHGLLSSLRFYYYLPIAFSKIIMRAVRSTQHSSADIRVLSFLLITPLLYLLGFKGVVKSPFGRIVIEDRDKIRSVAHGIYKTHFCYLKDLTTVSGTRFFPIIMDVGANIGDFTLALANRAGRIVAIEPGLANFHSLEKNIAANNISNVTALKVAAHSQEETIKLTGIGSMLHVSHFGKGENVVGLPLDVIFDKLQLGYVDLLKLDVQGHEQHVLQGMGRTLRMKRVGILVVEIHPIWGIKDRDLTSAMTSYGYNLAMEIDHGFSQPHLYFTPHTEIGSVS